MTFDEFFKKKRIDLSALQKAEPALFSEFETHYEQMGEKSFDHTKKYWFNKTRRQFPLAAEVKTEKPHIANPIAEQTITESLSETFSQPAAKVGFTPRFKANVTKPATEERPEEAADVKQEPTQSESTTAAKPAGFVPRFKMKPKTEEVKSDLSVSEKTAEPAAETPVEAQSTSPTEPASKPAGFTPRFKMKPKAEEAEAKTDTPAVSDIPVKPEPEIAAEVPAQPSQAASKPAGFTPRFKMKPKVESDQPANDSTVVPVATSKSESESNAESPTPDTTVKKPAYKPRFVPPKPKEE